MNNDGIGFLGAGASDNRIAGEDLQHNRQSRTADEAPSDHKRKKVYSEGGGPMKEHMEHHHMHEHLHDEKMRHEESMEHHEHHLEKHHGRNYDSQHGHDTFKY